MNIIDNLYYHWPLVTVITGDYEPDYAADILNRVDKQLDEDARVLLMKWMVEIAREEIGRN